VGRRWWLVGALGFLILAGCVAPARRTVELVRTYNRAGLFRELGRRADSITTLKARLDIHYQGPQLEGPQSCDGLLRYQAPDRVRLRADRDFVGQIFDLASDGQRFWCWFIDPEAKAPREVVTGTLATLGRCPEQGLATLSVNLGEVLGLLRPPEETATQKLVVTTYPDRYLIDLVTLVPSKVQGPEGGEPKLLRRWWVDRVDLTCPHIEVFGETGELVLEVTLSRHRAPEVGLAPVAREVRLCWPEAGETLTFQLRDLQANQPLKPSLFRLEVPEGAQLIEFE